MFIDKFKKQNSAGFSLVEILLAISIVVIVINLTTPRLVYFYKAQRTKQQVKQLAQTIRLAQALAWAGWQDQAYGVYLDFTNQQYVLYQGQSYIERQMVWGEAEPLQYFSSASSTFLKDDIHFTKNNLTPSQAGTISLVSNEDNYQVSVFSNGLVQIE